jgi:hypothetical protein
MTRVQHGNASARAQTETVAAHMAHLSVDDDLLVPTYPTTLSEFATRFNPILNTPLHPQSVRFESQASSATTTRQPFPEQPRVFPNPFNNPIATPGFGPQMTVIQRAAVELLSHLPTYNVESTAAAMSFIGAGECQAIRGRDDQEMIIACAARFTRRAAQWYEIVKSSDLRPNVNSTSVVMLDLLHVTLQG